MSYSLADVSSAVEVLWPIRGAEGWDASGLIAGHPDDEISRVLLAVDAVDAVDQEALTTDTDLLLVHHPLLLRGVTSIAADRYKGSVLTSLIRGRCALLAAHTNADVVNEGTSGIFAERLGLRTVEPLVPNADGSTGIGRVGLLEEPMSLGHLAHRIAHLLPATATGIRVAGDYDRIVQRVALCGGAGDSLLGESGVRGADVYITSDLRHHPASESIEQSRVGGGPALIDVSHWASEWLWLDRAAEQLAALLPDLHITVSDLRTDPWDFVVTQ